MNTVQVVYLEHCLAPHQRRIVQRKPTTIRKLAPDWQRPHIALLNGEAILRKDWGMRIKRGDVLAFVDVRAIPQGGGGGGSDPLQTVLMIAVIIAAPYAAAAMGFTAGTVAFSAATIGVQMAGIALVNALIPPPKLPTPMQTSALAAASPTYSLQAQGNQARLEAAIPEHFGRMLAYPDFAAMPYTEFAGNEQYLYQLLCIGRGEYSIEAVRLEDTAIASFDDITYEVVAPGGSLTLFPADVITSVEVSGQSPACASGTYARSGTTVTVTQKAHGLTVGKSTYLDFAGTVASHIVTFTEDRLHNVIGTLVNWPAHPLEIGQAVILSSDGALPTDMPANVFVLADGFKPGQFKVSRTVNGEPVQATLSSGAGTYTCTGVAGATDGDYVVATVPTPDSFTVADTVSGTASGAVIVSPWVGGFIASASGTAANFIGVDYVLPRGLYYATDTGKLANVSLTVTAEARTVNDSGTPTSGWAVLGTPTYTAATSTPQRYSERYAVSSGRYEVRMRRVSQVSTDTRTGNDIAWAGLRAYLPEVRSFGDVTLLAMRMKASNNLSLQGSRKINVIATRKLPIWNGASWSANTATRSIAWPIAYACKQMGLSDAQIDLATLLALDAIWTTRGDTFDARFDGFMSFWEAVAKMAGAGRAKPYMQGGVMRVMRDQAASIPVALFSVRNIVKGSFSIDYLMPTVDTADAIDVGYFDSAVWAQRRVRAKLPGSTAARAVKVELFGVVSRDQAFREGMYQAAANRYRRKHIKFSTEMEGFIPSFGDLIAVQHDMPAWGSGGEVTGWNAGTKTATLTEPVTFGSGTNYIALRKKDGSVDGPYAVTAGSQNNQVVFASSPTYTPYTGTDYERTHYSFGTGDAYMLARVISVVPRSLTQVEIQAVNEDNNVHTAETGQTTPARQVSGLTSYTSAPAVVGLTAISTPDSPDVMLLSWQPSAWADKYLIEMSSGDAQWTRVGETSSSSYTVAALYGSDTQVRVAAIGAARGPWATAVYTIVDRVPGDIDILNAVYEGTTVWLSWNPVNDPRRIVYEVRCGDSWGSGVVYQVGAMTRFKVAKDGTWWVAAKTVGGTYSLTPKAIRVEGAVLVANVISTISEAGTGWSGAKDGVYEYPDGSIRLAGFGILDNAPDISSVPDIVTYGGFIGTGTYTVPVGSVVDIGIASACQVSASLDYDVYDPITILDNLPDIASLPDIKCPLGGKGAVALEMNLAQNDGVFSGWQSFVPGIYFAREFDFRAKLSSTGATVTPVVHDITTMVDVPDRIESGEATTPAGSLTVSFTKPFHVKPKMQITILDAQAGDDVILPDANITTAQFTASIKNGGSNVSRKIHYLAQSY